MHTLLTIILVVTSLTMIVAILLQSGKGSGLAAGFGGASAGTQVFGGSGAGGFLLKMTAVLGGVFMVSSIWLAYLSSQPQSALAGVESSASSQGANAQEEQIVTHGSGAAPAAAQPADNGAATEDKAPVININPSPAPEGADSEESAPEVAPTEGAAPAEAAEPAAEEAAPAEAAEPAAEKPAPTDAPE